VGGLVEELKAAQKRIAMLETRALQARVPELVQQARHAGEVRPVAEDVGEVATADELRGLAVSVRDRLGTEPAVVALAARVGGKAAIIVAANEEARDAGHAAGPLAK